MDRKAEGVSLVVFVMVFALVIGGLLIFSSMRDRMGMEKILSELQGQDCTEDMDCWNCETMGNHICGPGYGSND